MAAAKEPGTDLVLAGEQSNYLALRVDQEDITNLIAETLNGEALQASDLERVKVPSGGRTKWDIVTADGEEETVTEIVGVILDSPTRRAMWVKDLDDGGGGSPPDCFSADGRTGTGEPGGACVACPLNEFGTASKGEGKKCKETNQLFVLMSDSLIPIVLNVPPSSLKEFRAFRLQRLRGGKGLLDAETIIGLEKATSAGNIDYAKLTFRVGTPLEPGAKAFMREYAAMLRPQMDAVAVEVEDVAEVV